MNTIHYCAHPGETLSYAKKIAPLLKAGDILALSGDLGAGKTTFSRGIIQFFQGDIEVPSPTYTLVQTYEADSAELWHCDLYRLEHPEDAEELGLFDAFEDAICLLEWPEKLGDFLPSNRLNVYIRFKDEGREIELSGSPEWEERLNGT